MNSTTFGKACEALDVLSNLDYVKPFDTYAAWHYRQRLSQAIDWGRDQRTKALQVVTILDNALREGLVPVALEEAGAGAIAAEFQSLPALFFDPNPIKNSYIAAQECDEQRGYLLLCCDRGTIGNAEYQAAIEVLKLVGSAVSRIASLLGAIDYDCFLSIERQILKEIEAAWLAAERINPHYLPTRRRFQEARESVSDQLYNNVW